MTMQVVSLKDGVATAEVVEDGAPGVFGINLNIKVGDLFELDETQVLLLSERPSRID